MKEVIKSFFKMFGLKISRLEMHSSQKNIYDQDGLKSEHNHDFMDCPRFQAAYARGIAASGVDYRIHWRVHVALWAAAHAAQLKGDFVECGVNKGFLSSAIMEYLSWGEQQKTFYLFDTFQGLDLSLVSTQEKESGIEERNQKFLKENLYTHGIEGVIQNFSQWQNVKIVQGSVPATLDQCQSEKICYLHLDMNCTAPEVAALEFFWDKIVSGGIVLLDDYAYNGYIHSKNGMDEFTRKLNVEVLSIPTGQGLLIKP